MFTRQNRRHNWMEEKRGSLMVVATVITTMTFQIAINPPGGVWQSNADSDQDCATGNKTCHAAGTSVFASAANHDLKLGYEIFILLCTVSFSASLTTILSLICGIPLRNKCLAWLLIIFMCISVICTAGAYAICIWLVLNPGNDGTINQITRYYALFWGGLSLLLCLVFFCRFVFWLLKFFFRLFCCCCSCVQDSTQEFIVTN
uniref:PGG domain-containing protein n=2 Tax=Cajanus cajan TaxID=3821 RepID=A0A151T9H3_CAJCA|nr:hypothetical protein KK1_018233 [Cajanus cajan]